MLSVAVIGPGTVGEALVKMLLEYKNSSRSAKLPIRIVGITNSRKMVIKSPKVCEEGINTLDWKNKELMEGSDSQPANIESFVSKIKEQYEPAQTVLIDCTSNEGISNKYYEWLQQGFNVVTPNKKAFSGSLDYWKQLKEITSRPGSPMLLHEATAGAGLPTLSTLNNLVLSGDKIEKIEGILSGTLSFLFGEYSTGKATGKEFSKIVQVAKDNGFTEPDPRDDLNGMDVARKVVILARLSGVDVELKDLDLENIVPSELREVNSVEEFMQRLPEFDNYFAELNNSALENNQVLRYVGNLDLALNKYSVKLMRYPTSHAFANLKPGDNIVSFTTKYFPNPLIIQGAGAGADVTAFGIFCDVLKVAEGKFNL
ncbi:Bifunctional aspartokinase/homoserine dehydrogenase 1, chloroplastic [Zancudomyces culisetae]|uniref:Homoserine dehydrogenase n=1 Tax=Zancudomyces culisetae TaxID=1213189 RepID=A0A1R1PUH7_ZANCU|nr:Bifunctional aspartokinase/homoserine dehydrogenase 1, chloroplastic [Zancudomyces culisetae]|eukprot:OMH84626.1 Bifunctional aspartokinase/homoserine dehydrogenase 1, chloroplastic [Zancudomyces culisetae]